MLPHLRDFSAVLEVRHALRPSRGSPSITQAHDGPAMMTIVRVALGSDHAGYQLKAHLAAFLKAEGNDVIDLGTESSEPVDYPRISANVAQLVASGEADRGIIIGGSGQGEQIAANKVRGIRAALCNDLFTARLSRAHNDANVLTIGARIAATHLAEEIVKVWLDTTFDGGRHQRRVDQIADLEQQS